LNALYQESPIPTFTWQKREDDLFLIDFNRSAVRITDLPPEDVPHLELEFCQFLFLNEDMPLVLEGNAALIASLHSPVL